MKKLTHDSIFYCSNNPFLITLFRVLGIYNFGFLTIHLLISSCSLLPQAPILFCIQLFCGCLCRHPQRVNQCLLDDSQASYENNYSIRIWHLVINKFGPCTVKLWALKRKFDAHVLWSFEKVFFPNMYHVLILTTLQSWRSYTVH